MTWIIGATTYFGYAVLVSDIRVTLGNRRSMDVLQKAFRVGDFVVAGFAGSVPLGFDLLRDLGDFLRKGPGEEDSCWQPRWVAENWSLRAKALFDAAPAQSQAGGSSVLMVGAEPDEKAWGGSRPSICVLRGPLFEPEVVSTGHEFRHIGSGAGVAHYERSLTGCFTKENFDILQAEIQNPGGFGRLIGSTLGRAAYNHPDPTVSKHMHIFIVRVGHVECFVNNMDRIPANGPVEKIRMPSVAANMEQLGGMLGTDQASTTVGCRSLDVAGGTADALATAGGLRGCLLPTSLLAPPRWRPT